MDSSPLQESGPVEPKQQTNSSSKTQKSINPSLNLQAPPPSIASLMEFPALLPPAIKPTTPVSSSPLIIGALMIPAAPPHKSISTTVCAPTAPPVLPSSTHTKAPAAVKVVSSKAHTAAPEVHRAAHIAIPGASLQQAPTPSAIHSSKQQPGLIVLDKPQSAGVKAPQQPSSRLLDAYAGRFDFKPRHSLQGTPCLSFLEVDKNRLLSKIQNIVIVKFSHNRPKFVDFRMFLDSKKFDKSYRIVEYDKKHIFIVFECFNDFVKLWVMKSVVIKGFKARFFSWDENFNPSFESFVAPVWIHLPGLPLFMFDEEVVLSIGALFGKILYIDPACLNKDKIGVLSFCVSMDVREKKLVEFWVEFVGEGIHVTRFLQRVVYGDIPSFCSSCKHLGHSDESCKVLEAVDLREKLKGKKVMQEVDGSDHVIPTVSVFKRLGVLSAPTKGKDLGESSTARGSLLEEVEVVDVTDEEEIELAKQDSAVREPSLEPHNSLGSNNGEKTSGALETRVDKLQNGSIFGPLAAVNEEEIAVENHVLQVKSAVCVKEATLTRDISLTRPEEEGSPSATESQAKNIQNSEKMGAKSAMVCSETDLVNRVSQNSAADSDEEATLLEDFSQLVHGGSEFPSGVESQVARIQDAEEIKAIAAVDCPEKRFEVGVSLQSAADFNETQTLTGHISPTRDNQAILLGDPESSLPDLQNDASLNIIAAVSEELSSDESGVSTYAATTSNEHNFCSRDDTDLILGPTESRDDHLQVQGEDQVSSMLVNKVYSSKVIITHPVTKEVIVLPPSSQSLCATTPKSALEDMSKNERKRLRKKQKREAEKKGKSVVEPIVLAEPIASPPVVCKAHTENWETLDSNASKDTPFWANYHAAQKDASLFAGLDAHPYMFMLDSEDELSTGYSIPRHSRRHPTYKERKERDRSLDYLDLQPISAKGTYLEKPSLPAEPPKATEEFATPPRPTSWATKVEEQDAKDAREFYTMEELAIKITDKAYEKLQHTPYANKDLGILKLVKVHMATLDKKRPRNDDLVEKISEWYKLIFTKGTPENDHAPFKEYKKYLVSLKKPAKKLPKDLFDPP